MSIVRFLIDCVVDFLDAWSGANYELSPISTIVTIILFAIALLMYFTVYWKIVSPKCYKLWMCSVLSFLICALICGAFTVLCIVGEWIVTGVF